MVQGIVQIQLVTFAHICKCALDDCFLPMDFQSLFFFFFLKILFFQIGRKRNPTNKNVWPCMIFFEPDRHWYCHCVCLPVCLELLTRLSFFLGLKAKSNGKSINVCFWIVFGHDELYLNMFKWMSSCTHSGGSRISHRGRQPHRGVPTPKAATIHKYVCWNERIWILRGCMPVAPPGSTNAHARTHLRLSVSCLCCVCGAWKHVGCKIRWNPFIFLKRGNELKGLS